MNVKYQIFVSSTYEDLRDERNEVIKACLNMGHIPVGMEMFNAADEEQWAVITRTIDQCDYYVVIVAHRYGSTTPEGISFTEKEYDYAAAQGVPVLGFVIDDGAPWPHDRIDKDQAAVEALRGFKSKVKQKMVRFWEDKSRLQAHFAISLGTTININPRRGWVPAPEMSDVDVVQALSKLTEENAHLRKEVEILRLNARAPDNLDALVQHLQRREVPRTSTDDREPSHIAGTQAFREIAQAIEGRQAHLDKIARKIEGKLGSGQVDRKGLESLLTELAVCGLCFNTISSAGLLWHVTELGQRMYVRLAKEAIAGDC
jgi:hypothetical protein